MGPHAFWKPFGGIVFRGTPLDAKTYVPAMQYLNSGGHFEGTVAQYEAPVWRGIPFGESW